MNPCFRVILQRKHKFIGSSLTFCHTRVCLIFLSNPEILISAMNGSFVQSTFWRYKILQYLKPATNTLWKAKGLTRNLIDWYELCWNLSNYLLQITAEYFTVYVLWASTILGYYGPLFMLSRLRDFSFISNS